MSQSPHQPMLVTSAERRWVLIYAAIVLLVTSIPYILAYALQGSQWQFAGFVFGVEDGNSYIAKMLTGEAGAWLFRTPYSSEYQRGVIAFLPYLLLGKLAAPPGLHEQLVALYQFFRLSAGFLVIFAVYDFISLFCQQVGLRRLGLILVSLGGGLGWLLILLGYNQWLGSLPLEFYSPETFGFLALFGIPHLALARATLLWGLVVYLRTPSGSSDKWYLQSLLLGLLWLVTAIAQPITAVVLGIVIALHLSVTAGWQFWRKKRGLLVDWTRWCDFFRMAFCAGLIVLPFMAYNLYAFSSDSFLRNWTAQNIIRSPHPYHYLIAFGVLIPFAIIGARTCLRRDPWKGMLLVAWSAAIPILAYVPFNLQRRLPDGIWVALVTLAMISIESHAEKDMAIQQKNVQLNRAYRWRFVLLLLFPSTLFFFAGSVLAAMHPAWPLFHPSEAVRAYEFLARTSAPGEVVLASYDTGNALPAWAPVRVVIGHGPESVGLVSLSPQVARFFEPSTSDQTRLDFLSQKNIHFVFWGPAERELGGWDPNQASYLKPVYHQDDYSIFAVISSG